jgi:hypothetical protein
MDHTFNKSILKFQSLWATMIHHDELKGHSCISLFLLIFLPLVISSSQMSYSSLHAYLLFFAVVPFIKYKNALPNCPWMLHVHDPSMQIERLCPWIVVQETSHCEVLETQIEKMDHPNTNSIDYVNTWFNTSRPLLN